MGVFIDYAFKAECDEPELLGRMNRLRERLLQLPFDSVSPVTTVDPAYEWLQLDMLTKSGYALPEAVRSRIEGKFGTIHDELCLMAAPIVMMLVPEGLRHRFMEPALRFMETTKLWRKEDFEDFPEKLSDALGSLTLSRGAFAMEMASVMLRHGYLVVVQPCEGCETFFLGLTRYRPEPGGDGPSLWLGSGITKTQYATRFVQTHEAICRALDMAAEAGLLLEARDNSGFYAHRTWSKSADFVNTETTLARAFGRMIGIGIEEARKAGVPIEDLTSPATRNYNLIRTDGTDAGEAPAEPGR